MTDTETPEDTGTTPQGDPEAPELGDAGKRAIAAEREARSKAEKLATEYKTKLDKIEQDGLSELEKANRRAADAEEKLTATEKRIARLTVIADKQIPAEYHDLIHGNTEDELLASAEKVAALVGKAPRGPVIPGQGQQPSPNAKSSPADAFGAFLSNQLNP